MASPDSSFFIESMQAEDWPEVRRIFVQGIATGNATFETHAPSWEEWDAHHLATERWVARSAPGKPVLGWIALSPYSSRAVYQGVAEDSVYIAAIARGVGLGRILLTWLIEDAERQGFWTLQAGIFPENKASLALHQVCGFRLVGNREKIGRMNGTWRDVLLLEWRSTKW